MVRKWFFKTKWYNSNRISHDNNNNNKGPILYAYSRTWVTGLQMP